MVLLILAGVWAVFLVPPLLRDRKRRSPAGSITTFRHQLSTLERSRPSGSGGAGGRSRAEALRRAARTEARRRRQEVLLALMASTLVTGLMAAAFGGSAGVIFLATAVLLGAYLAMLAQRQKRTVQRQAKVRYLRPREASAQPAVGLRRSASS